MEIESSEGDDGENQPRSNENSEALSDEEEEVSHETKDMEIDGGDNQDNNLYDHAGNQNNEIHDDTVGPEL